MRLVERHIIKDNRFEEVCHKSGLLYNYVLYNVRQRIFSKNYLKEYEFSTKLNRENQFDFRNLPCAISQQVIAQWMSFVGDKGISKRLKRLICYRNLWINDKMHKISRFIIDFCKKNNIGTIVIGLNKNWKQNINLGKKNNQKFVEIPFSNLVDKISYKAKLLGIDVKITEESYTSKVDHLAFETLEKHDIYLGKRKKRGLFQSSVNQLINADINGSIGIARKVFGDSAIRQIIGSGLAFNPIRVNIL